MLRAQCRRFATHERDTPAEFASANERNVEPARKAQKTSLMLSAGESLREDMSRARMSFDTYDDASARLNSKSAKCARKINFFCTYIIRLICISIFIVDAYKKNYARNVSRINFFREGGEGVVTPRVSWSSKSVCVLHAWCGMRNVGRGITKFPFERGVRGDFNESESSDSRFSARSRVMAILVDWNVSPRGVTLRSAILMSRTKSWCINVIRRARAASRVTSCARGKYKIHTSYKNSRLTRDMKFSASGFLFFFFFKLSRCWRSARSGRVTVAIQSRRNNYGGN